MTTPLKPKTQNFAKYWNNLFFIGLGFLGL